MRSILLCVDGSDYAIYAAEYAIALARLMDARVDILYLSELKNFETSTVMDFGGHMGPQPSLEMVSSLVNFENDKSLMLEKRFIEMFESAGLKDIVAYHNRTGLIGEILAEFKNDLTGLDLIVVGKSGESSSNDNKEIGKTLDTILHAAQSPCLVAPKNFSKMEKILIAYDGSDGATRAIHFVERNSWCKACEIHVLSVAPDKELKQDMKKIEEILSNFAGLNVTTIQKKSEDPVDAITKYINKNKFDLLMTGSFNNNIIKRLFKGSTTINLLETSKSAVMVF